MPAQMLLDLPPAEDLKPKVREAIITLLRTARPSAKELIDSIEKQFALKARWDIPAVITALSQSKDLTQDARNFLGEMIESGELAKSLRGDIQRDTDTHTGIAELLRQGKAYRGSHAFAELVNFCAKFREYAPFNNLLVRTQNPSCSYYATQAHWRKAFNRTLKEDARPMVILAPRQPVLLVYDIGQTEGPPLPKEMENFAKFDGEWNRNWLEQMIENAAHHYRIRINFWSLSSTNAGFATIDRRLPGYKMRIAIHEELDDPSRFGVLCHELAHIFLGHLGNDNDHWWPNRWNIDRNSMEVEAEAAAFIVTWRLGLRGGSAAYVSRHMLNGEVPEGVSADHIAKVAGRIEQMCRERLPARSPKKRAPHGTKKTSKA